MKKIFLCTFLLPFCLNALDIPQSSRDDRRITFAKYNANDVVRINANTGYVSVIEFAKEERVLNMATGFSEGWDLVEKGNLLFITPKAVITKYSHTTDEGGEEQTIKTEEMIINPNQNEWRTNLIVTTNLSMYVFELNLNEKSNIFKLSFVYPQKELDRLQKISKALEEKANEEQIQVALNRTSTPRNWDFYQKVMPGSESIKPNYAYDDGVFTYLGFDNTKTFPSVFGLENGKEEILNIHVKKDGDYDVVVIQKILPQIVLRSGDKVIGIINKGYAKNPLPKTRQTSNDEQVERVLKDAK